jgi:hypothetical protein
VGITGRDYAVIAPCFFDKYHFLGEMKNNPYQMGMALFFIVKLKWMLLT